MAGNGEYNAREISIHALLAESDMSSLLTDSKDVNFYPRSPCGERLCQLGAIQPVADISIHALLAESDDRSGYMIAVLEHFYPRSPCGERPVCHPPLPSCPWNFYPRSPCGERLYCGGCGGVMSGISIHALLAESDVSLHVQTSPL